MESFQTKLGQTEVCVWSSKPLVKVNFPEKFDPSGIRLQATIDPCNEDVMSGCVS